MAFTFFCTFGFGAYHRSFDILGTVSLSKYLLLTYVGIKDINRRILIIHLINDFIIFHFQMLRTTPTSSSTIPTEADLHNIKTRLEKLDFELKQQNSNINNIHMKLDSLNSNTSALIASNSKYADEVQQIRSELGSKMSVLMFKSY